MDSISNENNLEIKTSPELIRLLGEKLYSNPLHSILTRELIQNAVDSHYANKTGYINVNVTGNDNVLTIDVDDKGCGMNKDVLTSNNINVLIYKNS